MSKARQGEARLTPARPEVADIQLQDRVEAALYVAGQTMQVLSPCANVQEQPHVDARLATQAVKGERLRAFDPGSGDYVLCQLEADQYVGWVRRDTLTADVLTSTHKVSVLRTILFSQPDLKSRPLGMLSLNSAVAVDEADGHYSRCETGGWVYSAHLSSITQKGGDFVAFAEMFRGAPYVWGGKDSLGLDCSGLVQSSMRAAGTQVMRDADMQENSIGIPLEIMPGFAGLQRGDLVFWPGHVGIMINPETLLHANAHHMACQSEPLAVTAARIEAATKKAVRTIRRPFPDLVVS